MIKTAQVKWIENMKIEGTTDNGKKVMMDTGENASAASPAQLLLQALAGCTMMDCVLMLTKARKNLQEFWIDITAEEAEKDPRVFTKIHLVFNFTGSGLDNASIERAIKLSEEKYCRVQAMLRPKTQISSSYNINNIG